MSDLTYLLSLGETPDGAAARTGRSIDAINYELTKEAANASDALPGVRD